MLSSSRLQCQVSNTLKPFPSRPTQGSGGWEQMCSFNFSESRCLVNLSEYSTGSRVVRGAATSRTWDIATLLCEAQLPILTRLLCDSLSSLCPWEPMLKVLRNPKEEMAEPLVLNNRDTARAANLNCTSMAEVGAISPLEGE